MHSNDDDLREHPVTIGEPLAVAAEFGKLPATTIGEPPRLAGPWSRYWARGLDIILWVFVIDLPIAWYAPSALEKPMLAATYLMTLPLTMILDAFVYSLCGNTPGKSMAGLRVQDVSGTSVGFDRYLRRNFELYLRGLALGISIIAIFTMISAYGTLVAKQRLSWDQKTQTRVLQLRSNWWRSWLVACLYVGVGAGSIYFGLLMKSPETQIRFGVAAANATMSTMVDEATRFDGAEALPGLVVQYNFTLLTEDADEVDQKYREAFEAEMRKSAKSAICTSDDASFSEISAQRSDTAIAIDMAAWLG